MSLFKSDKCRLLSMLCLTFFFFLIEIVVGYLTNSTALIADSFHMLSDVVALVIAFVSLKMSPKKWSKNTFGWARAEVLGALINAVFLVALLFSIVIESLKRIVDPEKLHNPMLILGVGVIGLLVNVIGLGLFHEHGHSHGHSHHHNHVSQQEEIVPVISKRNVTAIVQNGELSSKNKKTEKKAINMNMRGVFLHVLADALGSVIVIISALIVQYTNWDYNLYVDPCLSLLMVIILGYSTMPLLIDSALILLQTVPTHIQIDSLQRKLLDKIDGVLAVHEFHVWQLAGDRIIASAHIRCRNLHDYMQIAEKVKEFFHNEGIHSTTIQPEFIEPDDLLLTGHNNENTQWSTNSNLMDNTNQTNNNLKYRYVNDANCALDCPPGQQGRATCLQNTCCGPQQKRTINFDLDETEIQKAGISGQLTRRMNAVKLSNDNLNNQDLTNISISVSKDKLNTSSNSDPDICNGKKEDNEEVI